MTQMTHIFLYVKKFYKKSKEQNGKTKKIFIHDIYGASFASFASFSQVWRCEVMAKHHHSDLPWSWLQNTKPYQLPPKNSIFWSSDFRKIPFLALFLYIFCTKMAQMPQCHTYIYTWKNFIKNLKSRMEKQKKYLYMIYMGVTLWHLWHSRCHKYGTEKIFIYIYLYIYKFAKIRILWTWYRSIQTMYFYWFFNTVYFLY